MHTCCHQFSDTPLVWTIIVSICAFLGVIITSLMLIATNKYTEITKNIFLASQRPYIGRTSFEIRFDDENHSIHLKFFVKNFGNVPARKVDTIVKLFIKDKLVPFNGAVSENQIFFPQENLPINLLLPKNPLFFNGIKYGESELKVTTEIRYYGVTDKQYSTTETEIYNHVIHTFIKQAGEWI